MQEHFESASGHARARASQLRKLGLRVTVSPLGLQVTSVGTVRMTMLTVSTQDFRCPDYTTLPAIRLERI
jgi:hypothetical protein